MRYLFYALFESGNLWLPALVLLVSVVEGAYIIRILANLWNGGEENEIASVVKVHNFKLMGYKRTAVIVHVIGVVLILAGILPNIHLEEFFSSDILSFLSNSIGGA